MWIQYLKTAFWAGPNVRGLGRLPLNALALLGFGILGFGHPAFWLMGAGLEAAYLTMVTSHPRFQRLVEIQRRHRATASAEEGREQLARTLDSQARQRLAALEGKTARILELGRDASPAGGFELESSRDALERLSWIYLKLLVARRQLAASRAEASGADLKRKIADLERQLAAPAGGSSPSATLRDSQAATLKLLRQRQQNLERCEEGLQQIDADLARIEAQVDLAVESASVNGGGGGVSAAALTANLELASRTLDTGLDYGSAASTVLALDEAYGETTRGRERASAAERPPS